MRSFKFAIGHIEAGRDPLIIRVYRPVLPLLAGAVGLMIFQAYPSFVFTLAATGTTLSISMFSSAE